MGEELESVCNEKGIENISLDGCDLSEDMLDVCKTRNYDDLKKADLNETLPFPENTYDGGISSGTFLQGM